MSAVETWKAQQLVPRLPRSMGQSGVADCGNRGNLGPIHAEGTSEPEIIQQHQHKIRTFRKTSSQGQLEAT
jgi:hypothetical protein